MKKYLKLIYSYFETWKIMFLNIKLSFLLVKKNNLLTFHMLGETKSVSSSNYKIPSLIINMIYLFLCLKYILIIIISYNIFYSIVRYTYLNGHYCGQNNLLPRLVEHRRWTYLNYLQTVFLADEYRLVIGSFPRTCLEIVPATLLVLNNWKKIV